MKRTVHKSEYFYGNKISEYGLRRGYLDYRTLAKSFDAVMVNDITRLFYSSLNGEYIEPEQINGYIDNSDEIDELQDRIDELEDEQETQKEIFQYFIISTNGAKIIQEYTNDPLYYIDALDMYIWGVTHWGTSWEYVLTDVEIDLTEV